VEQEPVIVGQAGELVDFEQGAPPLGDQ